MDTPENVHFIHSITTILATNFMAMLIQSNCITLKW